MPSAPTISRYNPSFYRFPVQNARTGYQPVYLPLILIVPGRRLPSSIQDLANSQILSAKYYIANAPNPALVAGPFNTGLRVPNYSLYTLDVTLPQLSKVYINLTNYGFYNPNEATKILHPYDEAVSDIDYFDYTTRSGNITYKIPYYSDADYYDVSYFSLDVTGLPAPSPYDFIWEVTYYNRITVNTAQAPTIGPFCISNNIVLTRFTMTFQHPGDVHYEMVRKTPSLYFSQNVPLDQDQVVNFYRPLADVFQDVADEQGFLDGINFISRIPDQLLPYLAFLIGWDLPNFPGATNTLRRAILRYAVYLQKLKGSSRAITELFNIFGYNIELLNLWYSTDGKQLIGPGEPVPPAYTDEEIARNIVCQVDPLIANYTTPSFGITNSPSPVDSNTGLNVIPLVYRATSNISVIALMVKNGPLCDQISSTILQLANNPDLFVNQCGTTPQGFLVSNFIQDLLLNNNNQILTYSEVLLDVNTGQAVSYVGQQPPLINKKLTYDPVANNINMVFDHYLTFDNSQLFVFALYQRVQDVVPKALCNLRSNRFDISITPIGNNIINTDTIQYLMNFLFKLKAFHSLLRAIIFEVTETEVYNVTDYCSPNFGNLFQPPAELPKEASAGCNISLSTDTTNPNQVLQETIYNALTAEHDAWEALDGTHEGGGTAYPEPARINPIMIINTPNGSECQFTKYGQDRVLYDPNFNPDTQPDTRPELCNLVPAVPPFCFTGRVKDPLTVTPILILEESWRYKPCQLSIGFGEYWLLPTNPEILQLDGFGQYAGQIHGWLQHQIYDYDHPTPMALKYYNKNYLASDSGITNTYLGYTHPKLDIQKDNFLFPAHRFPTLDNLLTDYTAASGSTFDTICFLKPWDGDSNSCDYVPMEASLVPCPGSEEDQCLVFPILPWTLTGNGRTPDISSLSVHEDRPFQVTHQIYANCDNGNPAITFDESIVPVSPSFETIKFDSSVPFPPEFNTYNPSCNTDYAAGYPANYGRFNLNPSQYLVRPGSVAGGSEDPITWDISGSYTPETELFYCGSEILLTKPVDGAEGSLIGSDYEYDLYKPYRLDCACKVYGCEISGSSINIGSETDIKLNINPCLLSIYQQPDGTYDFSQDQFNVTTNMQLQEKIGACSHYLNGEISNLLCTLPGPNIIQNGSIFYQDAYGVIYNSSWKWLSSTVLEIQLVTKSPHVWGQPDTGYTEGLNIYRQGIVSTIQCTLEVVGTTYEIISQTASQDIEFILMNPACGTTQYSDNFCYHLNCMISDEFNAYVTCGPRWTNVSEEGSDIWYGNINPDPTQVLEVMQPLNLSWNQIIPTPGVGSDVSDQGCVWPELILDSFGNVVGFDTSPQAFQWLDVWSGTPVVTVCGASEA